MLQIKKYSEQFIFILLFLAPTLFCIWFWMGHNVQPFSDDACYFRASLEMARSFHKNGILGYLHELSMTYRPLLTTQLGMIVSFMTGTRFNWVAGLSNSIIVFSLTLTLFKSFRLYFNKYTALFSMLSLLSMHWIVYLFTIFETQLIHLLCFNLLIYFLLKLFNNPESRKLSLFVGLSSALMVISRPFESLLILTLLFAVWSFLFFSKNEFKLPIKTLIIIVSSFVVSVGPWFFITLNSNLSWLKTNSSNQPIGPFLLKSNTFFSFLETSTKEFLLLLFAAIVYFLLLSVFPRKKTSLHILKNKFIIYFLILFCVVYPIAINYFVGIKNPIYFISNYFFSYMFLIIVFYQFINFFKKSYFIFLLFAMSLNLTLDYGGIKHIDFIHYNFSHFLNHSLNLPRTQNKQEENIYCGIVHELLD